MNSRPLTGGPSPDLNPLAPANLMIARLATAGMASIQFEKEGQLTKRLQAIRAAKDEFWNRWVREVFLTLLDQNNRLNCKET